MKNFYESLVPFDDFAELANINQYKTAPEHYYLVLTDVKNSTKAIKAGQYKDVNIIGSACIAAVEQATGRNKIAFIFGGDGASFLVAPEDLTKVKTALCQVRTSASQKFNLDLRVSIIPIRELSQVGQVVKVAKFRLAADKFVAKFAGGGLNYAESMMKKNDKFSMEIMDSSSSSFSNLSCRWQPVKNRNGVILTFIVKAYDFKTYEEVLNSLMIILGNDEKSLNPIKTEHMEYQSAWVMVKNEIRFEKSPWTFKCFLRILEILFCSLVFNHLRKYLPSKLTKYIKSMESHSDYRKFDDTLRMVIDCTKKQAQAINQIFSQLQTKGLITYGCHHSNCALMTCLVNGLGDGEHIHFVDGADGGYSVAAQALKLQETLSSVA